MLSSDTMSLAWQNHVSFEASMVDYTSVELKKILYVSWYFRWWNLKLKQNRRGHLKVIEKDTERYGENIWDEEIV